MTVSFAKQRCIRADIVCQTFVTYVSALLLRTFADRLCLLSSQMHCESLSVRSVSAADCFQNCGNRWKFS